MKNETESRSSITWSQYKKAQKVMLAMSVGMLAISALLLSQGGYLGTIVFLGWGALFMWMGFYPRYPQQHGKARKIFIIVSMGLLLLPIALEQLSIAFN
ncbi:hypothetical protein L1D14_23070 [Vibrio tubiashii]|uniref:hypothetical protein n=1 Tax=Vibrio tubiashii TaxID=29498 RepID=UPI001EFEDC9A|nr:hypothetical protein [Vibrio tubiashii]MCG9579087.1 hypothetical protein [Vibrio tubiashii]